MKEKSMRNISLCVLFLTAASGLASGRVTVTATDVGGGKLLIGYQTTVESTTLMAFALDVQLTNGATFSNVTSQSNIFTYYPGNFRDYINPANPDWGNPNYSPLAPHTDVSALGGLNTSGITIEMASMLKPYVDFSSPADFDRDGMVGLPDVGYLSNEWLTGGAVKSDFDESGVVNFSDYAIFLEGHFNPAMSGNLVLLQINGNGAQSTTASISLNITRGGIVIGDGTIPPFSLPGPVPIITPEPATIMLLGLGAAILRRKR
jgi:hypothetical protein